MHKQNSKTIRVKILDPLGNLIKESNLNISPGDTAVFQFVDASSFIRFLKMEIEERARTTKGWQQALIKEGGILVLPPGIKIMVIHRESE